MVASTLGFNTDYADAIRDAVNSGATINSPYDHRIYDVVRDIISGKVQMLAKVTQFVKGFLEMDERNSERMGLSFKEYALYNDYEGRKNREKLFKEAYTPNGSGAGKPQENMPGYGGKDEGVRGNDAGTNKGTVGADPGDKSSSNSADRGV